MTPIETLLTRRSVLAAKLIEPGPDADQLHQILRAGLRVPDHGKLAPWSIQVLRKPAQAALGDILARITAEQKQEERERFIEAERQRPQRAPLLLVVTSKPILDCKIPTWEQTLSAGALCQNILNACHALGFGAQWLTEWPAYNEAVRSILGLNENNQVAGFIYIGTAAEPPAERPRRAVEEVVTEWTP